MDKKRRKRLAEFIEPFRVEARIEGERSPRTSIPRSRPGSRRRRRGSSCWTRGCELLAEYQARLAAQDTWGVLVVLQALDAAGKDGTIRHVMSGVNPQGVAVHSFKVPSAEELDHDFLWRYAQRPAARAARSGSSTAPTTRRCSSSGSTPRTSIARSCPRPRRSGDVWKRRYREINDWERYLTENGFRVVKLFLNLSKEEQRRRLLRRIDLPDHNWKFSAADIGERELWDDYQDGVLRDALAHEHRVGAVVRDPGRPQVVRADRRRRRCSSHTLMEIDPRFPKVSKDSARRCSRSRRSSRRRRPRAPRLTHSKKQGG